MGAIKSLFLRTVFVFTLLHAGLRVLRTGDRDSEKIFVGSSSLVRIGNVSWSRQRIIEESKVFREVYGRRPVAISESGSNLFHAFAQWCVIRMVQPSLIVESGAMLGWGTWFLRQAAGTRVHIVVISPQCPNDVAEGKKPFYVDTVNSTYLCNNKFKDFAEVDWVDIGVVNDLFELSTALVYFDDHQSGYRRLLEAQHAGFGHLLFDDGYPWPGDNYSLKQALDVEDDLYTVKMNQESSQKLWRNLIPYQDNFDSFRTQINHEEKQCIYSDVRGRINVYFEFPPLWEGPWRNMVYRHMHAAREPGLLNSREANEFLNGFKLFKPDKIRESSAYTFISYVELRNQKFPGKGCFGARQNVPEQFIPK